MANTFDTKFIQAQKKKLIDFKNQILNSMKNTQVEDLQISPDDASEDGDLAQVVISQNVSFGLREREIKRLREIDVALRKIDEGTYGYCEVTEEPIEMKRLEKMPWARLSLEAAEELERKQGFRVAG
ncbi:MAG: RNA polymerase-binding protein DksA [Bdellovibrionales bacterium CG12_big_fil_rev_8_21_14_0_65_38_15]|nr:MAG: RNA polymerase-binding protein DksA [Bdellovibrionales bacterium CG22_combo_CG10-13_8_21_14_all_38_13]PIQ56673.1 MAG: RNA polymerase-binding protein DksA [Bdellovibrionales bacterium CG12_big_fil_rev_8_21_14_0_65_38_15]PIR28641.1 MAG: RNA polymerase-binding protein DksA [Bdellovibrionales bacterium CG11_big_fil_rev_8_21_14_0_20_38_13]